MRATWDETWLEVAATVAKRSLCVRDQVGAVIVSSTNRIVDTGYNGAPAGFPWSGDTGCDGWCQRGRLGLSAANSDPVYDDCPALHAEANALMFSDREKRIGGTIYVSSGTCGGCAKLTANSGLRRAVYLTRNAERRASSKWYEFMRQCGLIVDVFEP